ncbi:TadE/TadG family type IV pilus assembly protein [Devosia sp. SL43]|uniref:TadE/TadG family type IV pilus assembly protein n=1 Tax=Devosia sp. SL43 TaxID=2806348 RepID=UPI001F2EA2CC|nr:TadE/TadG family type IV pilus assembly protein [Devosia sp. SL43]UJW84846.1 pilus assembly protein [Devosia sp. SL43]
MATLEKLMQWARQFRAANAGVAAVEFALILPIMLFVYVGMVEASALISVDRKVQSVSGAVGDLVARSKESITVAELNDYVKVAGGIMTPYPDENLEQIISQIFVPLNTDETPTVVWSRRYVHQAPQGTGAHAQNSDYTGLPDEIVDIARGEYVIVAESRAFYKPLYGIVFDQEIELYRENFYLPRFGGSITLQ